MLYEAEELLYTSQYGNLDSINLAFNPGPASESHKFRRRRSFL
jgi:hypothetical protein